MNYERIAAVLEKTADFLDAQEHEKTAAICNERRKMVSAFAEKYAAATGEDLSSRVIDKLTASDVDLVGAFQKLAARIDANTAPEDLGEPGDHPDNEPVYTTKKAALEAREKTAEANFLNWIMED